MTYIIQSSSVSSMSFCSPMPALLMRMSTSRNSFRAISKTRLVSSVEHTSATTPTALPPLARMFSTTGSSFSWCRAVRTTASPSWANSSAMVCPMP